MATTHANGHIQQYNPYKEEWEVVTHLGQNLKCR
jgi:hypothetical protein